MGFPTDYIEVQHDTRLEGESTYTFKKLWELATNTIIAYSDKPLRLSIKIGFMIALTSFVAGIYLVFKALLYGTPALGWSSLIVSLYFLGGIVISILGIIGIYLGKTFDETKKRPLYLIRNSVNLD